MLFVQSDDTISENPDGTYSEQDVPLTEAQMSLNAFWPSIMDEIKKIKTVDAKNQVLPLARIKKIMKLDEDVKMISAEAPLLFAKAAETFIHELTLRAWVHTENNKRRTLQRNDIAMAITKFDQFDFLIDIVPREDIKPMKKEGDTKSMVNCDQVQYYLQMAQNHHQALQQGTSVGGGSGGGNGSGGVSNNIGVTATMSAPSTIVQQVTVPQQQTITMPATAATVQLAATHQQHQPQQQHQQQQNILVTNAAGQQVGNIQTQQQPQQLQLVQQIVTPNGEITHVPINIPQNQLNLIRMQIQNQANQQPIIIQTAPMQGQQILQVAHQNPVTTANVYLNTSTGSTDD